MSSEAALTKKYRALILKKKPKLAKDPKELARLVEKNVKKELQRQAKKAPTKTKQKQKQKKEEKKEEAEASDSEVPEDENEEQEEEDPDNSSEEKEDMKVQEPIMTNPEKKKKANSNEKKTGRQKKIEKYTSKDEPNSQEKQLADLMDMFTDLERYKKTIHTAITNQIKLCDKAEKKAERDAERKKKGPAPPTGMNKAYRVPKHVITLLDGVLKEHIDTVSENSKKPKKNGKISNIETYDRSKPKDERRICPSHLKGAILEWNKSDEAKELDDPLTLVQNSGSIVPKIFDPYLEEVENGKIKHKDYLPKRFVKKKFEKSGRVHYEVTNNLLASLSSKLLKWYQHAKVEKRQTPYELKAE